MISVVSKRHTTKFYLIVNAPSLIILAMGVGMLSVFIKHLNNGMLQTKDGLLLLFGAFLIILAIYSVYMYIKNAPVIRIDTINISFNNQTFALADVKEIQLTGKRSFSYFFGFPMEAATLHFKDGETRYFFDAMYENSWELKSFLKHVIIEKTDIRPQFSLKINKTELDSEFYDTFKGNPFFSLRGLLLWGFIGWFTYTVLTSKNAQNYTSYLIYAFACIIWFFLFSYAMNYFKVSQSFLVVKNHNLFWRTKAYRLSEIKEIVFETQGKMPNCLRVITNDFRNKLYLASTLSNKTWLELKDKLESNNIKVRNECIPGSA